MNRISWNPEKIKNLAQDYTNITLFIKENASAWNAAKRLGISEEIKVHMIVEKRDSYTKEEVREIASLCGSRGELRAKNRSAYNAAKNLGIFDEVCAHMSDSKTEAYTYEELVNIVKKCSSRGELKDKYAGAYAVICDRDLLEILCAHLPSDKSVKFTLEQVSSFFAKENYKLISIEYINANMLLETICPKGHFYSIRYGDFQQGYRCSKCNKQGTSFMEEELFTVIRTIYPSTKKIRDRKVKIETKPYIKGFEIDIYIPELKLGIEFDGTYHHSFEYMRKSKRRFEWSDDDIKNYHEIKDTWFLTKGIKILHIKEKDWLENKQACIDKCLEFLGVKNGRLF